MIFIYDDGIHNNNAVQRALAITHPHIPCCFIGTKDIIEGCLQHCKMLIMAGGADLYFCEKLNGVGNKIIRNFVQTGGAYLGICAGAYYACASLDWNHGEISGNRELEFYAGYSKGPVFEWLQKPNDVYNGSWVKAAEIEANSTRFLSEYNGGGVFSEPKDEDRSKVIARYSTIKDTPPAVISGTFGKGKYILSSPHIERFGHLLTDKLYTHLNASYEWEQAEIEKLLKHEQQQMIFFKTIIEQML